MMFKINMLCHAEALGEALNKEFGFGFKIVNSESKMGLKPMEELTKQGRERVQMFINAFVAGVKAVDTNLDSIQAHLTKAIDEINKL